MRVSIITINYNNEVGLSKTIESVKNQTYKDIEFIIIDGGSSDSSTEVIKQQQGVISYWVSEKDRGVYHAMNKGIRKATGEFLLFLNSGDYFYSESVLEEVSKFFGDRHEIIYGNVNVIPEDKNDKIISYPDELRFSHVYNSTICHQAMFYHRNVFQKAGLYEEQYTIAADWAHYISAIFKHNCSPLHIPITISTYPLNGISEKQENMVILIREREEYMRKEFPLFISDYEELKRVKKDLERVTRENFLLRSSRVYKLNLKLKRMLHIG